MKKDKQDGTDSMIVFLDVETRPDPVALQLSGAKPDQDGRGTSRRAALHEVVAAATLSARVNERMEWSDVQLRSWARPEQDEVEILTALDTLLRADNLPNTLVTYGGSLHDLPVIRRRVAAHWLFSLRGASRLEVGGRVHIDLMRGADADTLRWTSLRDACAAIGLPLREQDVELGQTALPKIRRKCEVDVTATALLYLHERALDTGDLTGLAQGWVALADHLDSQQSEAAHLKPFRGNARIKIARSHLASREARTAGGH